MTTAATAALAGPPVVPAPLPWEELAFATRFVVWTMRLWLAADVGDPNAVRRFGTAFDKIGGADAVAPLDALMSAVADGSRRAVALAPVHSPWLTADEVRLVDAVALAQGDDAVDVLMVLRPLLTADACRRVRGPLRSFARALARAGLSLPVLQGGDGAAVVPDAAGGGAAPPVLARSVP
ncbi:hypothetical protein [Azospirillum sp. ST 5-10]|uniref:hypothetical protein n=1 Tax=unclassified Azospirillum TaxID=2630922 RepID=UPI003F49CAC1